MDTYSSGIDATPIQVLCTMDVVMVLVKYNIYSEDRNVMLCSTYLPQNSVDPLLSSKEMVEVIKFLKGKAPEPGFGM